MNRREFLKKSVGFAGMALTGLAINPARTWSRPTRLKITDIRGCTVASNFDYPIVKIYTNQDVYGLGEVRDAGYLGQALILKPYLIGKDPLDIEGIMESLRPHSDNGRFGGGFSGVDMALFDIAGKVLGVPAYKILGEKVRDKIPSRRHQRQRRSQGLRQADQDPRGQMEAQASEDGPVPRLSESRAPRRRRLGKVSSTGAST
jgi:L-alanine-DL-glutamate epimerase-like enolase superfamily enzyme